MHTVRRTWPTRPIALLAISLAALLISCTYRVANVPPPNAFAQPLPELLREYPDIAPLFPDYSADGDFAMARAEELLEAWGEPEERTLSWWNLWPGNWPFAPQYLWSWKLSNRTVTCRIDHPFYDGYRPTVCNCLIKR